MHGFNRSHGHLASPHLFGDAVFPQYCTLFIAGVQDDYFERHKLGYWSNVYGPLAVDESSAWGSG